MNATTITATGGTNFQIHTDGEFIGSFEFGTIDSCGQYQQDDDEIIEYAAEQFGLDPEACTVQ